MQKAGYLEEIDRITYERCAENARTVKQVVGISFLLAVVLLLIEPAFVANGVKAFAYGLMSLLK